MLKREVQKPRAATTDDDFAPVAGALVLLVAIAGFTGWAIGEEHGYNKGYDVAKWIYETPHTTPTPNSEIHVDGLPFGPFDITYCMDGGE